MMERLMKIFHQIKETSGKNDKMAILKQHKNDIEFSALLSFLYNPYIITGIGKKKMDKFKNHHVTYAHGFDGDYGLLDYLVENSKGVTDEVVKTVANYINCLEPSVQEFAREVVTKTFKCGITSSTINKVYGKNYIPKHDIMLAKSWEDEEHKVAGDFLITPKLDGLRCTVFKENGEISFYTRKGLPILGMYQLEKEFEMLPDNMVYDGELLIVDHEIPPMDRLERFRLTQKRVRTDGEKVDLEFHMYEMLPIDEFKDGKSKLGAFGRKEGIFNLIKNNNFSYIKRVPIMYFGSDKGELMRILKEELDKGLEGIMVSPVHSKYECKRSSNLLKAKKIDDKTIDLKIIGFEEGNGKYVGTLGKLVVDYKGSELRVGSGLSDADRSYIWSHRDELLGTIVEVKYDDLSENQDGGESLRYPIFVQLRDDKDDVSYYA